MSSDPADHGSSQAEADILRRFADEDQFHG
jgi:hypothetical protein